ncbi:hypothetical protein DAEQUDRAFT_770982 [Daedalea quercina L-15889]|uniref:Uncharacterized protein n=1 Tax=Daedalea quercina L-15889 TaxID=1314783 RepID=A0A165KF41_9APHY|nr:hypothetical protein DAEQUDRAFT_770982 [Daedalea quercina L-15889]
MDALAQVSDVAINLYMQQDLLEDAIHEYANVRDQATRMMMLRLRDLEDQVVIQATAHDMVPLHNVQYTSCTLPPDIHTLADLMRANIFTPTAARSWRIVADHLFLASRPIMNHYPTDLILVYFCTKQITLENVTRWFVVHGGRVDGAYYDLQQATEQSLHMGMALEQGDYPLRPLTPYPAACLRTTLTEHPTTLIGDSPTGVDKNIPPWNWMVDDNFELTHGSASTPPPIVPPPLTTEERGWIAHRLLTNSPNQEESVKQCADRYHRQLLTSEPCPSSGGSETGNVLSTGTEEVIARLTYHRDGTTTFRGVEGS